MKVKIKKLHKDAVIPNYSKPGDAGMDLTITKLAVSENNDGVTMISVGFGISVEIPEGYVGFIFPRSSIYKTSSILSNSVGVIDSGYRGELQARFYCDSDHSIYKVGDRAAQLIIMPYPEIEFEEVDELSETERGSGGFGSTGK